MLPFPKRMLYLVMGVLILSLAACEPSNGGIPVTGNSPTPGAVADLSNTTWRLVSYGVPGSETPVLQGTSVTLQFQAGGQAGGSGGCNSFGAHYQVTGGNNLSVTNLISTMMACTAQGVMDQETSYFDALRSAGSFQLSGDQLVIRYENGQKVLNFSRGSVVTPVPSATPASTQAAAPTAMPTTITNPTATQASGNTPERIEFAPGATSATVTGQLQASGSKEYVLRALGGQTLDVTMSFTEGRAILAVWGEDGNVLLSDHAEVSNFHGVLPTTQDYHILLKGRPDERTVYSLAVSVPSPTSGFERITFAPGTTSATLSGQLPASGSEQYVIHALGGQTLNVDLNFAQGRAILVVWGADGQVLLSDHAGASSFRGVLPSTQDYYILLKGRPEGGTSYTMTVFVPPSS